MDVFISYSRKDKDFTQRLFAALAAHNRDAWVDWEGIPYSADWWREICTGIDAAETFIFIISPDSLASMICHQEIGYARENHKRILPVIYRPVEEKLLAGEWFGKDWEAAARDNWAELKRLNWLFFRETDDFEAAFNQLLQTAEADPEHVRFHTRLLVRAREWEYSIKRDSGLLLRGDDLRQAENWLAFNTSKNPPPTDLHAAYIRSSLELFTQEQAAEQRQRERLRLLVAALSLLLVIALGASIFAVNRSQLADANAETAVANAATATNALGAAAINLKQAWDTQALFLADLSKQQLEGNFQQTALSLALESLTHYPDIHHPESANALVNALRHPAQERLYMEHQGWVGGAFYSTDESRILAWSDDGTTQIWDASTGQSLVKMTHNEGVQSADWDHNERLILTRTNNAVYVWDGINDLPVLTLPHDPFVRGAAWSADESRIFTAANTTFSGWDAESGEKLFSLDHEGDIYGFVPDREEKRMLSWSNNYTRNTGTLYLWDMTAAQPKQLLALTHDDVVLGAIWNADETRFLSWSRDTWATVWDAETGEILLRLEHPESVDKAMWNADESRIMTFGYDSEASKSALYVWDAKDGRQLLALPHEVNLFGALWNRDETRILSWSNSSLQIPGSVTLWDADTGALLLTLRHNLWVQGARWNSDESRILSWSQDGTARVWDMQGNPLLTLAYPYTIFGATWNADETQILVRAGDPLLKTGHVSVWTTYPREKLFSARHEDIVVGAVWNQDESRVLSWSQDGTARIWEVATGRELLTITQPEAIQTAAWNHDETHLLTIPAAQNQAQVWDAESGDLMLTLRHRNWINGGIWKADSSQILTWSIDYTAKVWKAETGEPVLTLLHPSDVKGAVWHPDQSRIMTWTYNEIRLWDAESGLMQGYFKQDSYIRAARWTLDGQGILTWSSNGSGSEANVWVWIWDGETYQLRHTLPHQDFAQAISSEDGSKILSWGGNPARAAGSLGGAVYIWDMATGEQIQALRNPLTVTSAQWNADKTRILALSNYWGAVDSVVKIWDLTSGEEMLTLPQALMLGAVWNTDETRILAWGGSREVWIWYAALPDWIELGKSMVTHPLSNDERTRFFLPTLQDVVSQKE